MTKYNFGLFILSLATYTCITLLFSFYILEDEVYFNSFIDKLDTQQIERVIALNKKYQWVSLVFSPLLYLVKLTFTSISIYFIKIINGKALNITFSQVFTYVTKADFIFLILGICKLVYFIVYPPNTLEEIQNFAPGSLLQLVSQVNEAWLVYPLQAISIWELGFISLLAYQLKVFFQNDFVLSLQNVLLSYGTIFLLWIVFVVFITLNLS